MCDVISCLFGRSSAGRDCVFEAAGGPWHTELWSGPPHRCLTDTAGVNVSHNSVEEEEEEEERETRHILKEIGKLFVLRN